MRLTVHIPDKTERDLKTYANNEHKSLSSIVADSIEYYIKEKKKKAAMQSIKGMIGKVRISKNALKDIDTMRLDHDRS
jgi:metal-responsive CopG/Arc/MetJ family transcriptional regulator